LASLNVYQNITAEENVVSYDFSYGEVAALAA
jgi:hypothetical protein